VATSKGGEGEIGQRMGRKEGKGSGEGRAGEGRVEEGRGGPP